MAYKRKYTGRGRAGKRKMRRKMNISRPIRSKGTVLYMKRTVSWFTWTPGSTTASDFWKYLSPALDTVTSYTEMAALFDQYKINGVKLKLVPRYDSFAGNDTTDTTLPGITNQGGTQVHVIVDPLSQLIPVGTYSRANLNTFLENGNVRTYTGNKPINIFFKPTVSSTFGGLTTAGRIRSPWLSTASPSIVHNGVHVFIQDVNLSGVFGQTFDVFCTLYMAFRNPK